MRLLFTGDLASLGNLTMSLDLGRAIGDEARVSLGGLQFNGVSTWELCVPSSLRTLVLCLGRGRAITGEARCSPRKL